LILVLRFWYLERIILGDIFEGIFRTLIDLPINKKRLMASKYSSFNIRPQKSGA